MNDQSIRSAVDGSNGTDEQIRSLQGELENVRLIMQSCPACRTVAERIGPLLGLIPLRTDGPKSADEVAISVRMAHEELAQVVAALPQPREASDDEHVSLWADAVSALAATERLLERLQEPTKKAK